MRNQLSQEQLIELDSQVYAPFGRIPYFPLVIDKAQGSLITDKNGRTLIDLFASASSLNVGHAHPKVVEALTKQANTLMSYSTPYVHHEPGILLAQKLTTLAPDFMLNGNKQRVVFGNSGSDSVDGMIKIARAATGRQDIIAFQGAYHGSTYGSISVSAVNPNMRSKMGPFVSGVHHIPYPDVYHNPAYAGLTDEEVCELALQPLHELFAYVPPTEIAAILIEPIAGDLGIIPPPAQFIRELRAICTAHGIVLAADEVNQGMGRTGTWWSMEQHGVAPDLFCTAKSLGSGMPISAVIGRADLMEVLDPPAHTFTTAGNPTCAAAALATLEIIEEEHLLEASTTKGAWVKRTFEQMREKHSSMGAIHGVGLNMGVDIINPETKEPDTLAALKICYTCFEEGVFLFTIHGNTLRIQPPLNIADAQLETALQIIEGAIEKVENNQVPNSILPDNMGW